MPQPNGERIRAARQELGIKTPAFAQLVQVSTVHMQNIERGHNTASIEVLYRIARQLGVPISDVLVEDVPAENQGRRPA